MAKGNIKMKCEKTSWRNPDYNETNPVGGSNYGGEDEKCVSEVAETTVATQVVKSEA